MKGGHRGQEAGSDTEQHPQVRPTTACSRRRFTPQLMLDVSYAWGALAADSYLISATEMHMTSGIDLIVEVAGCANRCRHCYASGMPYRPMALAQYTEILSSFKRVCERQGLKFYPYPMHDVSTHPNIVEVIQATVENSDDGIAPFQPFVTPGDSLALRDDLGIVLQKLERLGIRTFWLTIHGREEDHDWVASRQHSYRRTMQTISRLHSSGYSVGANYLINNRNAQYFPAHAEELRRTGLSQMACEIAGYSFSPIFANEYSACLPDFADVLPINDALVPFFAG